MTNRKQIGLDNWKLSNLLPSSRMELHAGSLLGILYMLHHSTGSLGSFPQEAHQYVVVYISTVVFECN